jgi:hypothetical protein
VSLEWWSAERLVAAGAVGQLVILVAAALYARAQVREARVLREDQARPFVVVDFDISAPPTIRLAISNIGKTVARDVRVRFDPPLRSSLDKEDERVADLPMLNQPIPTMPPGKVYSTLFDVFIHAELPGRYEATVSYRGDQGREYPPDTYPLDLGLYAGIIPDWQKTTKDLHEELQKIARTLERWSAGIGSGLLVTTPEDQRRRREALVVSQIPQEPRVVDQAAVSGPRPSNGRARLAGRLLEVVGRLRRG